MEQTVKKKPKKSSKNKSKKNKPLTPMDKLKYEIARELGLLSKVKKVGWGGLSAAETGRIGGLMAGKKRKKVQN